ncbi:hypothetical protein J2752_000916 [Halarchaeum rubridurum]|uniref:Uncharacterized protein n=1 Tax=Halarchaeum rubridurum TaxID=489911 RepID=A0A830FJI8_9EURY|nr:hypothetical protein [Halarchaeum rubridurum]MBP1954035.1 hypothetical protein [Halarchaeum rubridurum]GGM56821.1 hypothetical protein GCM10009017_03740 [Halarchaeum rubridurum]
MSLAHYFDRWSPVTACVALGCAALAALATHDALTGAYVLVAVVFGVGVPRVLRDAVPVYDRLAAISVGVYGVVRLAAMGVWRLDGIVCAVAGGVALLELLLSRA